VCLLGEGWTRVCYCCCQSLDFDKHAKCALHGCQHAWLSDILHCPPPPQQLTPPNRRVRSSGLRWKQRYSSDLKCQHAWLSHTLPCVPPPPFHNNCHPQTGQKFRAEMEAKILKWQEPPPAKTVKPLDKPDAEVCVLDTVWHVAVAWFQPCCCNTG
jgi:hypothetical protein